MPVDSSGNPTDVATGELIDSPWGNATQERVVRIFPTTTARDAWTGPLDGVICFVTAGNRHYRRQGGVWQSIPVVVGGQVAATGDATGNANITFSRPLPATATVVIAQVLDYGNVTAIPFNLRFDGTQLGLRRPADNSPVVGIALTVGYIAVLL